MIVKFSQKECAITFNFINWAYFVHRKSITSCHPFRKWESIKGFCTSVSKMTTSKQIIEHFHKEKEWKMKVTTFKYYLECL